MIIRLDNGERQRLPVGETVKGWTLQSLESRRAMLSAATGQQAVLEMAFATDQTPARGRDRRHGKSGSFLVGLG